MMKKSIVLIEPLLYGHHGMYLVHFALTTMNMGYDTIILTTTPNSVYSKIDQVNYDKGRLFIKDLPFQHPYKLQKNKFLKKFSIVKNLTIAVRNLRAITNILKKENLSNPLLFFCCIDDYLHELMPPTLFKMLLPYSWGGLILSSNTTDENSFLNKNNVLKMDSCKGIGYLGSYTKEFASRCGDKLIRFPDFTDMTPPNKKSSLVDKILAKAKGRKIILLIGAIAERKGILTFVKTVELVDPCLYYFVIVGSSQLTQKEQKVLNEKFISALNCFYHPYSIDNESDFNALIDCCSILFAAYNNFRNSSNMLIKAAVYKKPLIVSMGYYMGEIVKEFRLGILIDQGQEQQCAKAIIQLTDETYLQKLDPAYESYLNMNSMEKLPNSFTLFFEYARKF